MQQSDDTNARREQCYATLCQLLAIDATTELRAALAHAGGLIARALGADKVDVFLYDSSSESLLAVGPPDYRMEHEQRGSGLDRLPLAAGGLAVRCFQMGENFRTGHADREPEARQDIVSTLGSLSAMLCRIHSNGDARGVLQAVSVQRDYFSEMDLRFLEAACNWMGLVTRRADDLVARIAGDALQENLARAVEELRRLTRRERQVAGLIAHGFTNDEIAVRLVLVRGTVANHVVHILRKLEFSRRVQIATWAVQQGLWPADED